MISQKQFRPICDVIKAALVIVPPKENIVCDQLAALAKSAAESAAAGNGSGRGRDEWTRLEQIANQTKGRAFASALNDVVQGKTDYRIILLRRDLHGTDRKTNETRTFIPLNSLFQCFDALLQRFENGVDFRFCATVTTSCYRCC